MAKKKATGDEPQDAADLASGEAETPSLEFEEALEKLEAIVRRLEQGNGKLDDALGDYAVAMQLLKCCHLRLGEAERKISILSGFDADGNPYVESIEETELTLVEKREQRGSRRSAPPKRRRSGAEDVTVDGEDGASDLPGLF